MNATVCKSRRHCLAAAAVWPALASVGCISAPPRVEPGTPPMTLRFVQSNGIRMRIAEQGRGRLVLLLHGWPESWYSWRQQIQALAAAGYHVVAPDMRGYGQTDAPAEVAEYSIQKLTGDVVGLIDALGEKQAVVVGHDWGAIVAWHCLLLHPQRFSAGVAMSVPYGGRGGEPLTQSLTRTAGDRFQYIVYFQEPGVAEREFDADPRALLSRLFTSPDTPLAAPQLTDPRRAAGGMVLRLGAPLSPPPWLSAADLDHYVNEFSRRGFSGGLNYYRNLEANWHSTPQLASAKITQPVLFMAGDKDPVLRGATRDQLLAMMSPVATDLRDVRLFANTGHWLQQQRAAETSQAIIEFLGTLSKQ